MTGTITDIDVQLVGFRHTFPDDVDILLVGPTGAATLLISDVGGGTDVFGINVALDDEAAQLIPDGGPMTAGTFRPTNVDTTTDAFPAPAPAPPVVSLTAFDGTNPNGTWSLYVIDDTGGDVGRLDTGFRAKDHDDDHRGHAVPVDHAHPHPRPVGIRDPQPFADRGLGRGNT